MIKPQSDKKKKKSTESLKRKGPKPASFICIGGVFHAYPVLAFFFLFFFVFYLRCFSYTSRAAFSFLSGEFLLHIPCLLYFSVRSFSYMSHAGFFYFFLFGEFLLHIPCWFLFFVWGVSLIDPVLASFLSGVFLLHILCSRHFYLGSISHSSRAGFIFIWGVSLTHPCLLYFSVRSFSYMSHAVFCLFLFLFF